MLIAAVVMLAAVGVLPPSDAIPRGWTALPTTPEGDALSYCPFQFPTRRVYLVAGDPMISDMHREGDRKDPLPFSLPSLLPRDYPGGDWLVYPAFGGWIVGFDAGEFGGGLWWFSLDGSRHVQLTDDNAIGFVPSTRGLLVLTGLSHMGHSSGNVLLLTRKPEKVPLLRPLAELPGAPYAYSAALPDTLFVGTPGGVFRVQADGEVTLLSKTEELPHPRTLVLSHSGAIYVGMMHYVLMLEPDGSGYKETWLVPEDCGVPNYLGEEGRYHCECSAGRPTNR